MGRVASPSSATGYQGCSVDINNFTFVQKRQGFPCGTYQVSVTGHDDIRVYINGNRNWISDIKTLIQISGQELDANSTVEIRTLDGTGDSYAALTFTLSHPLPIFQLQQPRFRRVVRLHLAIYQLKQFHGRGVSPAEHLPPLLTRIPL